MRSRTKDKVILRSEPDSIVTFNFTFLLGENRHTVNYKVQFEKAKSIREVADSFSIAAALLAHLYSREDNTPAENGKVPLSDVKEYFRCYKSFFKRLSAIETNLRFQFPRVYWTTYLVKNRKILMNFICSYARRKLFAWMPNSLLLTQHLWLWTARKRLSVLAARLR